MFSRRSRISRRACLGINSRDLHIVTSKTPHLRISLSLCPRVRGGESKRFFPGVILDTGFLMSSSFSFPSHENTSVLRLHREVFQLRMLLLWQLQKLWIIINVISREKAREIRKEKERERSSKMRNKIFEGIGRETTRPPALPVRILARYGVGHAREKERKRKSSLARVPMGFYERRVAKERPFREINTRRSE